MINKNKIFVLGASSFIGYSLLKFNINKKNWVGGVSKKNINYKNQIKKKRINNIKKKLRYFNYSNKTTFHNLDDSRVLINCIGFTKNFNNPKFDFFLAKKKFDLYYANLKNYLQNNETELLIHIGSSAEYGFTKKKIAENLRCRPVTKYGQYKLYEHNKLKKLVNRNTKVVNIRCFSIFGELNKKETLFEQIKNNKELRIKNPNIKIDVISVHYLNKLILEIINSYKSLNKFDIINFCSSNTIILKDLLLKLNLRKKIVFSTNSSKSNNMKTSNNKMLSFIQFNKKYNFKILKNYLN